MPGWSELDAEAGAWAGGGRGWRGDWSRKSGVERGDGLTPAFLSKRSREGTRQGRCLICTQPLDSELPHGVPARQRRFRARGGASQGRNGMFCPEDKVWSAADRPSRQNDVAEGGCRASVERGLNAAVTPGGREGARGTKGAGLAVCPAPGAMGQPLRLGGSGQEGEAG